VKSTPILFLLFQLGKARYALEASCIHEVLPLLQREEISNAPLNGAAILNYRGTPVSVIDLSQLLSGKPSSRRLSTRIILVRHPGQPDRRLGLMAERATIMMRRSKEDFVETESQLHGVPRLGPVLLEADGLIQWVKLENILAPDLSNKILIETPGGDR
jgi:chemotaxis-related protein WspB